MLNLVVLKSGCRAAHDAFQKLEGRQQLRHKIFDSDFTKKMRKDNRMKVVGSAPGEKWAWPRVTDCLISGAVIARKLESYLPGASQLRFRPLGSLPFSGIQNDVHLAISIGLPGLVEI